MSIPRQRLSIRDPGLGLAAATTNAFCFLGTAQKGDTNVIYAFSALSDVVDTLGQGPLPEDLAYFLGVAGGPVYGIRLPQTTAGAAGSVTKSFGTTSVGTGTVTVAGEAYDAYDVQVHIMAAGTLGTAEFRYTLDGGYSFAAQRPIPSGGTFSIPNTNLTLTFVPGSGTGSPLVHFNEGDVHTFVCTAPTYDAAAVAAAIDVLLAQNLDLAAIVLSGEFATGSAAAVFAAAMEVHAQSLFAQMRYVRTILDAGSDNVSTTISAFSAISGTRIAVAYGDCDVITRKPYPGWGIPRRSVSQVIAARCGSILASTDPARNATGALPGVVAISHDEFRTELLDQKKFSTLRTWQGVPGFYVTNVRLMSPLGSDYEFWQHGRLMDVACDTVAKGQFPLVNSSYRVKPDSTIDDRDASRWELQIRSQLRVNLLDPDNAEGTPGHVSAVNYTVDRTTNVLLSKTVKTRVAITPLGYAKEIVTELGFAAGVGG